MNNAFSRLLLTAALLTPISCAELKKSDPIDSRVNLSKSQFDKFIIKDHDNVEKRKKNFRAINGSKSIPRISSIEPKPPRPITDKDFLDSYTDVSFSVNDNIPLKDVLIELGRVAKIDVELDPNISGGIVISAHKKPLGQIIKRICRLGNLRYEYKNGILRFARDLPYNKSYFVDYLTEGSNMWSEVSTNAKQILDNERSTVSTLTSESGVDNIPRNSVTVNKSAGIISIYSSKRQHDEIAKYLKNVRKTASAQVLIEAKVVEVLLNDEFSAGINWSGDGGDVVSNAGGFSIAGADGATSAVSLITNGDIRLSMSALEKFGATRTLSSPRIHAINNRKSVLNFTKKLVYFKIASDTTIAGVANVGSNTVISVTSTKEEEEEGVKLAITPSINLNTNEVTLHIQPKITVKAEDVRDPAVVRNGDGEVIGTNLVPVMQTREIDTVAKIASGNAIVIGGLMQEITENTDSGIPFLQRIPVLGYLFKSSSKKSKITETVIFIKATIVDNTKRVGKIDRQLQEKFDTNRRKFF